MHYKVEVPDGRVTWTCRRPRLQSLAAGFQPADFGRHLPMILERLKGETATLHDRIEQASGLMDPALTTDRYIGVLAAFHSVVAAAEPRIADILSDPDFVEPRRRLPLLERDLAHFGLRPGPRPARDAAWIDSRPAAMGTLYVLEGSTLGGQVIVRRLGPRLGLTAERGAAYFNGYGARTGAMWSQVRARLSALCGFDDVVVSGAAETFRHLIAEIEAASGQGRPEVAA